MQNRQPVLVIGAGPTGLTAAMELSRLGVPVRIVEKATGFSDTSRALAVQARTLELMEQRGLAGALVALGNQGNAGTVYGDGRALGKLDLNLIHSRFNYILLVGQSETERILRGQLARQGVNVELKTEMVAFSQTPSDTDSTMGNLHVILKHDDGSLEDVEARFMISGEGAHSSVRKTLMLPFKGNSLPHSYALADVHADGELPEHELCIFLAANALLAIFPMGGQRFRLIATEAEQESGAPDPDLPEMQQLCDASCHIPVRLYDMVWSSRFRINSRMVDHLAEGLIFLGGDAAHIHSPAGGQGMNTGIQDMVNLAWKMALVYKRSGSPELLGTYGKERLPVIRNVVSKTEGATDLMNSPSSLTHTLVTHLASAALKFQFAQHMGADMLSEVEANYRDSPLSEEHGSIGTLRAGDRVPDLSVRVESAATKQTMSLLSRLNPSLFTLLVLSPDIGTARLTMFPETRVVRADPDPDDEEQQRAFHITFGGASLVLVRPDGYVAFLGSREHLNHLLRWYQRWLPTRQV